MMVNRALKGKTRAYISLAILLTPDEFETINRKDPDIDVLDEKEFGTKYTLFKSLLVKRSGMYICRTFFTEYKHNELVVYDIVDADETKVRAYFDNESLLRSKLNCGKDR